MRELERKSLGLALRQIDQDVGDVVGLGGQIDAGNDVGLVLVVGEPRGLGVGGVLGQGVDGRPLRLPFLLRQGVGVDGDEQRRAVRPRKAHPVVERDEGVVAARHQHAVLAALLEPVADFAGEGQDDVLLQFAVEAVRARIDAAMTGIEHDQRPRIAVRLDRDRRLLRRLGRPVLERDVAQIGVAVGGGQVDHEPCRLALGRGHDEGLVDLHRALGVQDDAGAALHDQAVAEILDQAAAVLACLVGQMEGDLRQVDDDPVRIGERERGEFDLPVNVEDEPGLLVVSADANRGDARHGGGAFGRRGGRNGNEAAERGHPQGSGQNERAECHESDPFRIF